MPPSSSISSSTVTTNVFEIGKYPTIFVKFEEEKCTIKPAQGTTSVAPPKPLLIATPTEAGEYPVILFLHGYLLKNSFYSQLLIHIASHGFIVIAPQVNSFLSYFLSFFNFDFSYYCFYSLVHFSFFVQFF